MTATLDGTIIPRQPKLEISILNLQVTDIPANSVVKIDATNDPATQFAATPGAVGLAVLEAGANDYPCGVTISDTPSKAQGVMQIGGFIYCVASGAIAAGAVVAPDTGGTVKTNPTGHPVLGVAWTATAASTDLVLVQINIGATG
jgi:predicted RecA/RadA family phage recombinase